MVFESARLRFEGGRKHRNNISKIENMELGTPRLKWYLSRYLSAFG